MIDLHRVQLRKHIPIRWRDKGLIGLPFAFHELKGITVRDIYRSLKEYFQIPLRDIYYIIGDL